jgi:tyrosinase
MASTPPRIRKDVYKLAATDKTLEWYGRAITEMKKRPLKDPTSWRYQAAIHGYVRSQDPYAKSGESMPSSSEQTKFWNQCQHGSWYFLSWHRGYLLYFERICLRAIVALGGPKDWALPYWNYSSTGTPNTKLIPPAFRKSTLSGGGANPLYVPGRNPNAESTGDVGIDPADVSLNCLTRTQFVGSSDGGSPGFGGPQTGFHHGSGVLGACEATPHNNIHGAVGGFMGSFNQAGLDPLFWLHHCNIDRIWEIWRRRTTSSGDPTSSAWRDFLFNIHNESGGAITFKSSQMSSTTANGYKYQDVTDPLAGSGSSALASVTEGAMPSEPSDSGPRRPAELAGASQAAIPLGTGRSSARVAIAPEARSVLASVGDTEAKRVFLNIENITGRGPPGTYKVYVNVPDGEDPESHQDHFVGTLPLFGIGEQSEDDAAHGGSGLTLVLEITGLVNRLQGEGTWNEFDLDVDFVPLRPVPEGADVKIGRLSVYHA